MLAFTLQEPQDAQGPQSSPVPRPDLPGGLIPCPGGNLSFYLPSLDNGQ
jgi:hypothetical protein